MTRRLERLDEQELLVGEHAPENGVAGGGFADFLLGGEGGHIYDFVALFKPRALCDGAHRFGIVARDDFDIDALFAEEAQGVGRLLADFVCDDDKALKDHFTRQFRIVKVLFRRNAGEHAVALRGKFARLFGDFAAVSREHEFHRAEGVAHAARAHAAPLSRGGEGDCPFRLGDCLHAVEVRRKRLRRRVLVARALDHRLEHGFHLLAAQSVAGDYVVDLHAALGDGARLVEAEHINTRERFHAVKVLRDGLVPRKAYDADAEHSARKSDEPRGYHAYHRAYGGEHGVVELGRVAEILGAEKRYAEGHDDYAHHLDYQHQRAPYLGGGFLEILCALGNLHDEVVGADVFHPATRPARHDEAARHHLVAHIFDDGVGLARYQCFVYFDRTI